MKTISIVIGTCNRISMLQQSLDSLVKKIDADHEIIVIDAGSSDGTGRYLETVCSDRSNNVRYVQDGGKLGQAKSLNRVFREMDSKYLCWLSDDNVVIDGSIDSGVGMLDNNNDVGLLGLKVIDKSGPHYESEYIGGVWSSGILNVNQGIIRYQLFKKLGFFDEEYIDYGIDIDITTKVLLAGFKVAYTKNIAVLHYRDYENNPGAIEQGSRTRRQKKAGEIYKEKYPYLYDFYPEDEAKAKRIEKLLCEFNVNHWTSMHRFKYRILKYFIKFLQIFFATMKIYTTRDMKNIFRCRYISLFDFFKNRNKDYYLVQSLPEIYFKRD